MSDKQSDAIIFQAANNHRAMSGVPPYIDTRKAGKYYGYFENEHREQFIFIYDYQERKATLWVGDNGWEDTTVIDGKVPTLILSASEVVWLQACWTAATTFDSN